MAICEDDAVLDIAGGTGYSSAVLGCLAGAVVSVESDPDLSAQLSGHMTDLGMDNVVVEKAPIESGWPDQAPYDAILVNGACGGIPDILFEQLADGGRLCAVAPGESGVGSAMLWTKQNENVSSRPLFDANVPVIPELESEVGFNF